MNDSEKDTLRIETGEEKQASERPSETERQRERDRVSAYSHHDGHITGKIKHKSSKSDSKF